MFAKLIQEDLEFMERRNNPQIERVALTSSGHVRNLNIPDYNFYNCNIWDKRLTPVVSAQKFMLDNNTEATPSRDYKISSIDSYGANISWQEEGNFWKTFNISNFTFNSIILGRNIPVLPDRTLDAQLLPITLKGSRKKDIFLLELGSKDYEAFEFIKGKIQREGYKEKSVPSLGRGHVYWTIKDAPAMSRLNLSKKEITDTVSTPLMYLAFIGFYSLRSYRLPTNIKDVKQVLNFKIEDLVPWEGNEQTIYIFKDMATGDIIFDARVPNYTLEYDKLGSVFLGKKGMVDVDVLKMSEEEESEILKSLQEALDKKAAMFSKQVKEIIESPDLKEYEKLSKVMYANNSDEGILLGKSGVNFHLLSEGKGIVEIDRVEPFLNKMAKLYQ